MVVVDLGHLLGFSEEIFHLLAVVTVASNEVTYCRGKRMETDGWISTLIYVIEGQRAIVV